MKINGSLTLNSGGQSEVQNLIIERLSAVPSVQSTEKGRIVFNTTDSIYYYNNGTNYMAFATGGNASALQSEVDNLEVALGSAISASGTYVPSQFTGYAASATTITGAINAIEQALTLHNTLGELDDVTLTSSASGQALFFDGTKWVNHTPVLADISNVTSTYTEVNQLHTSGALVADFVKLHAVTSTAAELNILTGATLSTTELNYVDGVTSAIQGQLDNKQPLDDQLTSIAALTPSATSQFLLGGTGGTYSIQDAAGYRSALGVAISVNVQAYDLDLVTLAGFAPAADSSETITINGIDTTHTGLNDIIVGTGGVEGARWTLERGASARTSLGLGNIAVLDEARFIRADAATGSNIATNINFNSFKVTGLAPGTAGTDAINLNQLEAYVTGLSWKTAVTAATTAPIVLATIGLGTVDGYAITDGARVLVKNQAAPAQNGIYVASAGAWTRALDFNEISDAIASAAVFVTHGTVNAQTGWVVNSDVTVIDTSAITWVQFNGTAGITGGTGLSVTGNTINVNLGAGIAELPSDEVGIDLYSSAEALILTTDGSTRSTDTAAKLHILLDLTGNGQLEQSAAGLRVTTNTITEAQLTASVAGNGLVGGNGTALAVVSHAGTAVVGGDLSVGTDWDGVGLTIVTSDSVGVKLGSSSTTAAPGNHTHKAAAITFDNSVTGGSATTVQGELVVLDGRIDTIETNAGSLLTEVNTVESAVGLNTDGTLPAFSGTNYLDSSSTVRAAEVALDTALKSLDTTLTNKIGKMYYLYTGSSATTHTVTHTLGQKYVNVTVVDSASEEVILPQSITFTDANNLVVTCNVAIALKIIVMGLA